MAALKHGNGFDRNSTKMMKIGEISTDLYSRNGTEIIRMGDDSDMRSRAST
jgi:hypothetical protein